MKSQSLKLFVAALIVGLFTVGSAFAQSLSFNVPFDFQIGKTKLESGKYEMRKLDSTKYLFRNTTNKQSVIVVSDSQIGTESSVNIEQLVFNRYGETCFLRQIFADRNNVGRELSESKSERNLRRALDADSSEGIAKNRQKPEQVSVASAH